MVLYGVSGSVFAGLAWLSMLVCVTFHVVMRGFWDDVVWMLGVLRCLDCVGVSVDVA